MKIYNQTSGACFEAVHEYFFFAIFKRDLHISGQHLRSLRTSLFSLFNKYFIATFGCVGGSE